MPHPAPSRTLPAPPILPPRGSPLVVQAAGTNPGREGGWGTAAAPPGEARMESLFEAVGIGLLLAIAVAAAWILIRQRR